MGLSGTSNQRPNAPYVLDDLGVRCQVSNCKLSFQGHHIFLSIYLFLLSFETTPADYSPAEAQCRGLRSGGTWRGWWLPAARCWPREASGAETGSQTNCQGRSLHGSKHVRQFHRFNLALVTCIGSYSSMLQWSNEKILASSQISLVHYICITIREMSSHSIRTSLHDHNNKSPFY